MTKDVSELQQGSEGRTVSGNSIRPLWRRCFLVGLGAMGVVVLGSCLMDLLLNGGLALGLFLGLFLGLEAGILGAGLCLIHGVWTRRLVPRRLLVVLLLASYTLGYVEARRTHLLVHRTTYSGTVVSHSVVPGDRGPFAMPHLALYLLLEPACLAERLVWEARDATLPPG